MTRGRTRRGCLAVRTFHSALAPGKFYSHTNSCNRPLTLLLLAAGSLKRRLRRQCRSAAQLRAVRPITHSMKIGVFIMLGTKSCCLNSVFVERSAAVECSQAFAKYRGSAAHLQYVVAVSVICMPSAVFSLWQSEINKSKKCSDRTTRTAQCHTRSIASVSASA